MGRHDRLRDARITSLGRARDGESPRFFPASGVRGVVFDRFLRRSGSIRLVGTAHVSPRSRDRVVDAVRDERPDTVAIELDADRFTRLWNGRSGLRSLLGSDLSPSATLLALLFSLQQRRLAKRMNVDPGEADMLPAARVGREVGASVALVDASSVDSLNALTARCLSIGAVRSFRRRVNDDDSRARLQAAMDDIDDLDDAYGLTSGSLPERIDALETMPLADLERLVDAIETLFPAATDVMLRKRNEYMAGRLHRLRERGEDVVAVVGRAHVPGLRTLLDDPETIPAEHVTEPRTVRFVDG